MTTTEAPELVGGALCLDLANSVDARHQEVPDDRLTTYADLVAWIARGGGLDDAQVAALGALAEADPQAAADELARTAEVRDAVFDFFYGHATGAGPDPARLAVVQTSYAEAVAHARLARTGDGTLAWTWEPDLRLPRWLEARSAIELATCGPMSRVKACASVDGCQYLFVDTSKNNSRRWCSMADCGNTAKARRLTENRRTRRASGTRG